MNRRTASSSRVKKGAGRVLQDHQPPGHPIGLKAEYSRCCLTKYAIKLRRKTTTRPRTNGCDAMSASMTCLT
ncbi:hypothetical protein VTK56DRAFT_3564 [Thermocarpiscus australiensis]